LLKGLSGEKREWAIAAFKRKTFILSKGARKRGKEDEATVYEEMLSEVLQESISVGGENSTICTEPGFSSSDAGTVVGLESTR
jgi:hypothetical protein